MTATNRAITADACLRALDAEFFKALCEPSRLEVIRAMIKLGPADVGDIAGQTPQDRSVVSRHLQVLQRQGLAISHKEGRHMIYPLDGPAILEKLCCAVAAVEALVPLCCPGTKTTE
jgi:DNA-binding transcriptional ArsR family regulator